MNTCENLIQFDKFEGSNQLIDFFTSLQFVTRENYQSAKQSASGSFLDYFSGDYEQFTSKRTKLTEMFLNAGYTDVKNNYKHHILSKEGAQAFAECVRNTNNQQLSIWVENKTDSKIAINVRNGMGGSSVVEFNFNEKHYELPSNSNVIIVLDYNPKEDFMIAINSTEKLSKAKMGHSLAIPRVRNFKINKEVKELTGFINLGAGGFGSKEKNAYSSTYVFVADLGYRLLPETLIQTERKALSRLSLRSFKEDVQEIDSHPESKRVSVSAISIIGSDDHEQANEKITFSMKQEREFVEEIS